MKIAVVGAGGVGGFLGAALARAGHDVTLLARGAHLAAIRERGLELRSPQFGTFTVRAAATDRPSELGQNDLVFIAVKMYDFADACEAAKIALAPSGVAVPIENGLDAPEILAEAVGSERVLVGTIAIEAAIAAPGIISHTTPTHRLVLAEYRGAPGERLAKLEAALQQAQIVVKVAANGRQALWDKACMLIPFATLTAAGDCTLGEIFGIPALEKTWTSLCDEAIAVAGADGYDVRPSLAEMQAMLQRILPSAPGFTSSMNRDIRSGRRSELEWLTGKLVRLADEYRAPARAHAALYGILSLKSQRQTQTAGAKRAGAPQ